MRMQDDTQQKYYRNRALIPKSNDAVSYKDIYGPANRQQPCAEFGTNADGNHGH